MAHSIILLREAINTLRGTSPDPDGLLTDLALTVEEANSVLENGEPANGETIHSALHDLQHYLEGAVSSVTAQNTALRGMIE